MKTDYQAKSLSLTGAVAMGTGVMIGAGIFALTGQIAELAGPGFPWVFVVAALVTGFSAYSYVKLSNAFPSAGGIAMFLEKAYGRTAVAASAGLLMAFSMVINESLVARTFGTYTAQFFNGSASGLLVPVLGVALIVIAFFINISGNRLVGGVSLVMAVAKVVGIGAFAHPEWMMRRYLARFRVPGFCTAWILRYVEWVIGHRYTDIAPMNTVCRVKCPILLVHGRADETVPITDARVIQDHCRRKKPELLIIEGGEARFGRRRRTSRRPVGYFSAKDRDYLTRQSAVLRYSS